MCPARVRWERGGNRWPSVHRTATRPLDASPRQIRYVLEISTTRGADSLMLNRFATLVAVCIAIPVGTAPVALADPPAPDPAVQPVGAPVPPPDTGGVPSAAPGILTTPDGWTLTVVGSNETQL